MMHCSMPDNQAAIFNVVFIEKNIPLTDQCNVISKREVCDLYYCEALLLAKTLQSRLCNVQYDNLLCKLPGSRVRFLPLVTVHYHSLDSKLSAQQKQHLPGI